MLYENIKVICDQKGISISELEKQAGIGNGVIGKWRDTSARVDTVMKVADALDVPIGMLTSENPEKEYTVKRKLDEAMELISSALSEERKEE